MSFVYKQRMNLVLRWSMLDNRSLCCLWIAAIYTAIYCSLSARMYGGKVSISDTLSYDSVLELFQGGDRTVRSRFISHEDSLVDSEKIPQTSDPHVEYESTVANSSIISTLLRKIDGSDITPTVRGSHNMSLQSDQSSASSNQSIDVNNPFLATDPWIFPTYIQQQVNRIPILNSFSLNVSQCYRLSSDDVCGDFHMAVYYETNRSGYMTIRRLDELHWNYDIALEIFDISHHKGSSERHQISEKIIISKWNKSWRKFHFILNTSILLQPDTSIYKSQRIPKQIMETFFTVEAMNEHHYNAFYTFTELNPEYEMIFYLDKDIRQFIQRHFSADVLLAYDRLIPGAYRADLFRYCYLYVHGGCYFDHKMIARKPLRHLIQSNDEFLVCSDTLQGGIMADTIKETVRLYNAVICVVPQSKKLFNTINYVVKNILQINCLRKYHIHNSLAITGPQAFYEAIRMSLDDDNLRFKHGYHKTISSDPNIQRKYTDYFIIDKVSNDIAFTKAFRHYYAHQNSGQYDDLWNENRIVYGQPLTMRSSNIHQENMNQYQIYLENKIQYLFSYFNEGNRFYLRRKRWTIDWANYQTILQDIQSDASNIFWQSSSPILYNPTQTIIRDGYSLRSVQCVDPWFNASQCHQRSIDHIPQKRYLRSIPDTNKSFNISQSSQSVNVSELSITSSMVHESFVKVIDVCSNEEITLVLKLAFDSNVLHVIDLCLP